MKIDDILLTWFQTELPEAKFETKDGWHTVRIWDRKPNQELFSIGFGRGYMIVKCPVTDLTGEIAYDEEEFRTGKWALQQTIKVADPQFFSKLTICLLMSASIVTMGGFTPDWPKDGTRRPARRSPNQEEIVPVEDDQENHPKPNSVRGHH